MKRDFIVALLGAIFLASLLLLVANRRSPRRKSYRLGVIAAFIIATVFCAFPIENLFYTFPTAESAAQYLCNGEVIGIVEGKDSCCIHYSANEGESSQIIIPKMAAGYQIAVGLSQKQIAHGMGAMGTANVMGLRGSNDYYVFVMGFVLGEHAEVRDNCGSRFTTSVKKRPFPEENKMVFYRSYALLEEYAEGYQVIVEGTEKTDIIDVKPGGFLSSWVRGIGEGTGGTAGA